MIHSIAHLGAELKTARQRKKLSQRALSAKTKVPQGHLSKIERGETDLQTSSLIEISRALELELMLVPRYLIPTFKALLRENIATSEEQTPLYSLEQEEEKNV